MGLEWMLAAVTGLLAGPWFADELVRVILALAARSWRAPTGRAPAEVLVVVPARGEGAAVREPLASAWAAATARTRVRPLLLLDGADADSSAAAAELGVSVLVKEPAGPSKAAALAWLARHHPEVVRGSEAVLVLDVGSRLAPGFFTTLRWPEGAAAVQAWLRGTTAGAGGAVALSEAAAQRWQDCGRDVLGWSVRLRGTGSLFRPELFLRFAPRLRTAVEDTEATLLVAAAGHRVALVPEGAVVEDVKPERSLDAARQRARWLLGQIELLVVRAPAVARLLLRRPLEGLALAAELLSRPLVLSLAGRVTLAALWALAATAGRVPGWGWTVSALLATSCLAELPLAQRTTGRRTTELLGAAAAMLGIWLRAIVRLPAAARGWLPGRRP